MPGCVLIGDVEGCPFYMDAARYAAWNEPDLILEIAAGRPEGFSLGPGPAEHFVTRSAARFRAPGLRLAHPGRIVALR